MSRLRWFLALGGAALIGSGCILLIGDEPSLRAGIEEDGAVAPADGPSSVAEASRDAPTSSARCAWDKPFGPPVTLPLPPAGRPQGTPRLTADERTLFFEEYLGAGLYRIYTATRQTPTGAFGPPSPVAAITAASALQASPSANGGQLFFASKALADTVDYDISVTEMRDGGFGTPMRVDAASGPTDEQQPFLTANGRTLYFARVAAGKLFRLELGSDTPVLVEGVDRPGNEEAPVVSDDELTIWFSSSDPPSGGGDIYVAHRERTSDPFGAPTPVDELNMPNVADAPGWISRDLCRIYLTSFRAGEYAIYMAERSP